MKKLIIVLLFAGWPIVGHAATVNVWWDPNTEADIAGYRVYLCDTNPCQKTTAHMQIDVRHPQTAATIQASVSGNVAVTAYDTSGNESTFSNTLPFTIATVDTTPPSPPSNVKLFVH